MEMKLALWVGEQPDGSLCFQAVYGRLGAMTYDGMCCRDGHRTPEAAAQHGARIVAERLASWVRTLPSETAGAKALEALKALDE
jgi:hypothetical protein